MKHRSVTGLTYDEVQMLGAFAYLEGATTKDNPYTVDHTHTLSSAPEYQAYREAAAAWLCGYVTMKAEMAA
jgi:hypothetical protein